MKIENSFSVWDKKTFKQITTGEVNPAEIAFLSVDKASDFVLDYSAFACLNELWISSKKECLLPDSLGDLPQVKKLIVTKNGYLPQSIGRLKNLNELWLHGAVLTRLPAEIQFVTTNHLNLSFYEKELPPMPMPEVFFEMKNLRSIRLAVCRFSEISHKINQLEDLTELDFGCSLSDLSVFPNLSGLKNLQTLKASGESVQGQRKPNFSLFGQIIEAAKSLPSLKELDLCCWNPRKKADMLAFEEQINDLKKQKPRLNILY